MKPLRTDDRMKHKKKLCSHVSVFVRSMDKGDDCEYVELIKIKCEVCNKRRTIPIAIN